MNSWGTSTIGANCTAWNSLFAKALKNSPSDTPRIAPSTQTIATSSGLPSVCRSVTRKATSVTIAAWAEAARENAVP